MTIYFDTEKQAYSNKQTLLTWGKVYLTECTDEQFEDFQQGKLIFDENDNLVENPKYEEEKAEEERARINMLMLTGADVERAIYKDCGMDFEDVVALLETKYADVIDVKAVKIELKANNFYRGNPYVVQIGTLLGYSSDDIDYLFEHKELPTKENEGTVKDNLTVDETTEETSASDEE